MLSSSQGLWAVAAHFSPCRLLRRPTPCRRAPVLNRSVSGSGLAVDRIRNIGIVAHIDAGKTTTTERMLFYAGVLRRVGDVDSGTTTTDFMKEEADRGITIQSAAVSLRWKDAAINLIDTPGHVDFTVEVERAMRVVDGVVALFDASAGVQAQSYTVLQQSQKFDIPVLAFLNKMDKYNADFDMSVSSIRTKLQVEPLVLQLPYRGEDGSFIGVVDVVEQKAFRFLGDHGSTVDSVDLATTTDPEFQYILRLMRAARHELITHLTGRDDVLSEQLIEQLDATDGDEEAAELQLPASALHGAVRRCLLKPSKSQIPVVPVLCGASRRDQGVQPLLDAVNAYLPSPLDRQLHGFSRDGLPVPLPPPSAEPTVPTVALAFKVIHAMHPTKGQRLPLVFLRVYSGRLVPRMSVQNRSRDRSEMVEKLYVMHANEPVEVPHLRAGEIGAVFLPHTFTGDTLFALPSHHLLQAKQQLKTGEAKEEVYTLEGIDTPPAVLSYSVEAATRNQIELLRNALAELTREDPSLRVSESDQGAVIVSGMGELHLEIVMSRLANEHHVKCRFLRAIIEYRETVRELHCAEKLTVMLNELPYAECSLALRPLLEDGVQCSAQARCRFLIDKDFVELYKASQAGGGQGGSSAGAPRGSRLNDVRNAVEDLRVITSCFEAAVETCMRLGPLAGLPMHGFEVVLTSFRKIAGSPLQEKTLQGVARDAVLQLLKSTRKSNLALLEPMMVVEVSLSEPSYAGSVVSSLNEHRALTIDVSEDGRTLRAVVAMRNTLRYSMELRKAVKGHANSSMHLHHFQVIEDKAVIARILKNLGITE